MFSKVATPICILSSHVWGFWFCYMCLLIVMLSARNAWGYSPGIHCTACDEPPQTFPWPEPMLWLDQPLWFLWLQDASQQQPSEEKKKKNLTTKFIIHKSWRVHKMPEGHIARSRGEKGRRETRCVCVWGLLPEHLPFLGSKMGCWDFVGLLFGEFKT